MFMGRCGEWSGIVGRVIRVLRVLRPCVSIFDGSIRRNDAI
jgi:hypothetical protein